MEGGGSIKALRKNYLWSFLNNKFNVIVPQWVIVGVFEDTFVKTM